MSAFRDAIATSIVRCGSKDPYDQAASVLAMPEMQAIRPVLASLFANLEEIPDENLWDPNVWDALAQVPPSVKEWAWGWPTDDQEAQP